LLANNAKVTFNALETVLYLKHKFFHNNYACILKVNLSWSPTWAKFCQLIASLFIVLPQLNLTKLQAELEYLKFSF